MVQLTKLCSTGGCAAKYDAPLLEQLLATLPSVSRSDLLVGLDPPDDAAVMRLADGSGLVFTVDFFPPIVDEPATYGRIAANNAINDIYAMGAQPMLALSIAAFPDDLAAEDVAAIVGGAARHCAEAGAVLAGGHTIRDREPKFGLAVVGTVACDRVWRKSGALAGDRVLITKPIGTGLLATAHRHQAVSEDDFDRAIDWMLISNRPVAEALASRRPHAVTDVTGFGLAGHASEIARLSDVCVVIDAADVPFLEGAERCAQDGIRTSAHVANATMTSDLLEIDSGIEESAVALALDPQTAGGLMIAIDANAAEELIEELGRAGHFVAEVGHIEEGSGVRLVGAS